MAEQTPGALVQLSEKLLHVPIKNGAISYCPTMDLLALITIDDQVEIYRLNGQKVVTLPSRRSCRTLEICWKPNGSLLAVAYSDNSLSLITSQGGKCVHQIQCPSVRDATISFLSWTVKFTDARNMQERLKLLENGASVEEVVHRGFLGEMSKPVLDLPSDLAVIDAESILPKLSTLPQGGREGDVFTSRLSIDSLFHSKEARNDSSDALIAGFSDGSAYLSVHDFFEVGRFEPKQVSSQSNACKIVRTAGHPFTSSLGLLLRAPLPAPNELHFAPLDLRLISDSGKQFSYLAGKATQMQNVIRYLKECQVQIYSEFQTSQSLPRRFIANVEEDLLRDENCNFTSAVYHLVTTGNCSPVMKEWLVDQLAERGQKRWEKAATTGYENIRRLIHENFLPALDRLIVLCNRMRGLSLFQETAAALGLDTIEIDHIFDTIRCLQLLGHTTLMSSDTELRQASSFCLWLRREIDIQATETLSADELEKETTYDYVEILNYIQGPLQNSALYDLLGIDSDDDDRKTFALPSFECELYDAYKSALHRIKGGARTIQRLPGMESLIERLQTQCTIVFASIADTQQKKVRFGDLFSLGSCDTSALDIRMTASEGGGRCTNHIAVIAPDKTRMKVFALNVVVDKGISAVTDTYEALITVQPIGKFLDIKFIDDSQLYVLAEEHGNRYLFSVRYATGRNGSSDLNYKQPGRGSSKHNDVLDLFSDENKTTLVRHVFGKTMPPFVPNKIEVNGRKGRRAVCILAEDMRQYRIFDVDTLDEQQDATSTDEDELMVS